MKYSQWIGAAAAVIIAIGCYLPWVSIPSVTNVITGMDATGTSFGKPGKLHLVIGGIAIILFAIPKLWAKRTNWIFCIIGFAWALRNTLLFTRCELGVCPEIKIGLLLVLIFSVIMLAASLLPDLKVKLKEKTS
ncbi:MAG: hypothetical protein KIT80_05255 [Chitinophagaceae bacterium]|nr:hypothetical protein [Chitinophagaceae bacterium]MCW5926302.1 hypothetical protein [Chitinophagaceae bacterium]